MRLAGFAHEFKGKPQPLVLIEHPACNAEALVSMSQCINSGGRGGTVALQYKIIASEFTSLLAPKNLPLHLP